MATMLADARGVGEAKIASGALGNPEIVRTILRFLSGTNEQQADAAGEKFESITATFALADRVLRSEDLTLRGPDYDIFARGTLALPATALDVRADLVLSEALSGRAGRDVARYTSAAGRVVLPAVIGGTVASPRVRIDAGAVLRRGLQNEIERRLQDLFERGTLPF
jgi:hypothetical protein